MPVLPVVTAAAVRFTVPGAQTAAGLLITRLHARDDLFVMSVTSSPCFIGKLCECPADSARRNIANNKGLHLSKSKFLIIVGYDLYRIKKFLTNKNILNEKRN